MSLRIAVGGIVHETNTYCKERTPLADFELLRGEEMISRSRGVRDNLGGMIAAAEELGYQLLPTLMAGTQPSGTIERSAYEVMLAELLAAIEAAMPLDAVALCLHGAGVVVGIDDLEGHLCKAVRALVGPSVPIVLTLDLHGNITQEMADTVECMFGYHYYPHTDGWERGQEAIRILPRLLSGELKPVTHVEHLPIALPTSTTNFGPAKAVNELCWELERNPSMIDCTFFHGFPYCDIPQVGVHIISTANGDRALAEASARQVARFIWEHRAEFLPATLTPEQAIEQALSVEGGPIVINDTADNCGGGAPGDATHLLGAMLRANLQNACFGFIYDPEVAEIAHQAGVGATITVNLGGKYDELHGPTLPLTAYVKSLSDGRFKLSALAPGMPMDMGKMARLQVGGIDILVGSERSQTFDQELFLLNGIDVTRYKIVALKSSQHFRAGFQPLAKAIITADSPGLTTLRVEVFERERSPRPIWPLDAEASYTG